MKSNQLLSFPRMRESMVHHFVLHGTRDDIHPWDETSMRQDTHV
jgi:hypothetical protein